MIKRVLVAVLALTTLAVVPASADVTGDKLADVVTKGSDGRLWLFTNDGTPTRYSWAGRQLVGSDFGFANRMVFGDLSLDGEPDIVARDPLVENGTLWIHHHDATQPSHPWTKRIWAGIGWNISIFIMTGDVTGDGRTDIVTREADGRLWLYPHTGRTNAPPFDTRHVIGMNWQNTTDMLMADVTGDTRQDIVARDNDGFLWIFPPPASRSSGWNFDLNRRAADADDPPYHAGAGWDLYNQLQLADVTGDGNVDVLARDAAGVLWVFPHTGAAPGTNPWPARQALGDWWAQYPALIAN